jgi:O-antigen/teichoic acid export membrane protein
VRQPVATDVQVRTAPLGGAAPTAIAWRKLLAGGTATVVGAFVTNVLSFLFSFVTARLLRPEDFATVAAALSLLVIVTIPAATLQLVAARYSAIWGEGEPAKAASLARRLGQVALAVGFLLAITVAIFSQPLADYLRIAARAPVLIVAGVLACSFVGPVYRGLLQGHHRFGAFAIASSGEFAVRLLVGVGLVLLGFREAGALLGVMGGAATAAWLAWWCATRRTAVTEAAAVPWRRVLRWAVPTLLVQAALTALLFQDTLLAKHFFSPAGAGAYAGLATTARVLVYASGALTAFLFPVVARVHSSGGQSRLITNITLALLSCVEAAILAVYALKAGLVMHVVVGSQYEAAQRYLPQIALGLAAYGAVSILASYFLASGDRAFFFPLLAAPLVEGVLMALFHSNLGEFVHTVDVVMFGTLAVLLVIYLRPAIQAVIPEGRAEWR